MGGGAGEAPSTVATPGAPMISRSSSRVVWQDSQAQQLHSPEEYTQAERRSAGCAAALFSGRTHQGPSGTDERGAPEARRAARSRAHGGSRRGASPRRPRSSTQPEPRRSAARQGHARSPVPRESGPRPPSHRADARPPRDAPLPDRATAPPNPRARHRMAAPPAAPSSARTRSRSNPHPHPHPHPLARTTARPARRLRHILGRPRGDRAATPRAPWSRVAPGFARNP